MSEKRKAVGPGSRMPRFLRETGAGGFSRIDGTVEFYGRINALLDPSMVVLDFGAGRGVGSEDPAKYRRELRSLRGKAERVIGVDLDAAVLDNPMLDEAHHLSGDEIPLPESSVDLVVADYVFEHLENPATTSLELARILKPGGWICARTPNRWGYIGLGSSLIPESLQLRAILRLQGHAREPKDVFPTAYRLNTMRSIRMHFSGFDNYSYAYNPDPAYFGQSPLVNRVAAYVARLLPEAVSSVLMVFLRKRTAGATVLVD
jgi:SAM-dependent methyltransferase